MKRTLLIMFGCLLPAFGQQVKIPELAHLVKKADDVTSVTMDASMLQFASKFLSGKDPDELKAKKLISNIRGLYVRHFEFKNSGEYSKSDIEPVRSQLQGPGWSRIIMVRSEKDGDNVDVFVRSSGNQIQGLFVIAAEARELTFVELDGTVDPDQLRDLGGSFGIPKINVQKKSSTKSTAKDEDEE